MTEYEKKCDKIADKIHAKYKQNYKTLKDICKENNIQLEDFLYIMGYQNIDEYLKELEGK